MRFQRSLVVVWATVLLVAACLLAVACGDDEDAAPTSTPEEGVAADAGTGESDSISIPAIEVEAPLTPKQLMESGPLPSPEGPYDVAIYDFGAERQDLGGAPDEGGNVVMAGQNLALEGCVEADPPCGGVFRSLKQLEGGEAVDLAWQGNVYRYQVVAICVVPTSAFADNVYSRTVEDQLTLLTGAGAWAEGRGWSHVLVVIAKPAPRTAIEPCPEGTDPVRSLGG